MTQQWNRYATRREEYRGGVPVWIEIPKQRIVGGMLLNNLRDMEVLASGSPIEYNYRKKEGKILKLFKIEAATVDGANTIVTLLRTKRTPDLYAGMSIMVVPSTIDGVGKAITLSKVDEEEGSYKVTVVTADLDALKVGGFLAEAAEAGEAVKMFAIPNNLTLDDTVGGDQNTVGVPRGMKYLYENTIPAMPDIIKKAIDFVEWDTFAEL